MSQSDELLISKALVDRDSRAFDQLVRRYQSRVRGWLRHLARDNALADDLAQETFIKAWQKLASFRATGSFEAWLLTIARNQFLQSVRKSGREGSHLERLQQDQQIALPPDAAAASGDDVTDTERFLSVLGYDERNVMILVYGFGLSHAEASDVSGLPLGTVKSHVRRSVIRIRDRFGLRGSGHD